jgi:hypothetical protein
VPSVARLEHILHRHFHDPTASADGSKSKVGILIRGCGQIRIQVRGVPRLREVQRVASWKQVREGIVRAVDYVERSHTKLQTLLIAQLELFAHRQIRVEESWAAQIAIVILTLNAEWSQTESRAINVLVRLSSPRVA